MAKLKQTQHRAALFAVPAASSGEEPAAETNVRTVEFAAGAAVLRWAPGLGPYWEKLEARGVDLERFNSKAPLLDSHEIRNSLDVIGVTVEGTARMQGESGFVDVRFDTDERSLASLGKVDRGIVGGASFGYSVKSAKKTGQEIDGFPVVLVTRWQPFEVSIAPIPADIGAGFRADEHDKEIEMDEDEIKQAPAGAPSVDLAAAERRAAKAERERIAEVTGLVRSAGLPEALAGELVDSGSNITQARERVLNEVLKGRHVEAAPAIAAPSASVTSGADLQEKRRSLAVEALTHRLKGKGALSEDAREMRGLSLMQQVAEVGGIKWRGFSPGELYGVVSTRANSTSDFPYILAQAGGKMLMDGYGEEPADWEQMVKAIEVDDFKPQSLISLGSLPTTKPFVEGAGPDESTILEYKEAITLTSNGLIVKLTRQALINDDLGAFDAVVGSFGASAKRREGDMVFALLAGNGPTMNDGNALFHATHSNLNTGVYSGAAGGSLQLLDAVVRKQKGTAGNTLDLAAEFFICGADLRYAAERDINPNGVIVATKASDAMQWRGRYRIISSARITGPEFFLMVPASRGTIMVARLRGATSPIITTETDFRSGGLSMRVAHDFAAGVSDWRGIAKCTGV